MKKLLLIAVAMAFIGSSSLNAWVCYYCPDTDSHMAGTDVWPCTRAVAVSQSDCK